MRRSSPASKGQQVAQAIASASMGGVGDVLGFLDACPDAAPELIDLIVEEGRRKKPRERLLEGYLMMLAHALQLSVTEWSVTSRDMAKSRRSGSAFSHTAAPAIWTPAMLLAILGQPIRQLPLI